METPITIYTEMTPNPNTMKFVMNKFIFTSGEAAEFHTKNDAKGYSPLALELFNFPFVKGVFIAANFVTITKTAALSWDFITMELRDFIREFVSSGQTVVTQLPPDKNAETTETNISSSNSKKIDGFEASEWDDQIKHLLDEYVRPAVESDGGHIDFIGFDDGIVTLEMKGSCAGCPSSTATLKGGIENLLKQHIDEVKEVVAING
jgi:Fe-S cluster biogenesis protein NfuA